MIKNNDPKLDNIRNRVANAFVSFVLEDLENELDKIKKDLSVKEEIEFFDKRVEFERSVRKKQMR